MEIADRNRYLAGKMSTQLRVRGEGLAEVAARAGRKLPRYLRVQVDVLTAAEAAEAHPKLASQIDARKVARAERKISQYLDKQDPKAERRGEVLDLIAKIAFVFVSVVLAVFFVLLSRGYL